MNKGMFPVDFQQRMKSAQRQQDNHFDALLQILEYICKADFIDDPDSNHPEYIKRAYLYMHEWHNEILARLAETED